MGSGFGDMLRGSGDGSLTDSVGDDTMWGEGPSRSTAASSPSAARDVLLVEVDDTATIVARIV